MRHDELGCIPTSQSVFFIALQANLDVRLARSGEREGMLVWSFVKSSPRLLAPFFTKKEKK